jgi:hypothetical protein
LFRRQYIANPVEADCRTESPRRIRRMFSAYFYSGKLISGSQRVLDIAFQKIAHSHVYRITFNI